MKFSDLLSTLGLAPKTLDQAKAAIDTAKPALDSVASLFTAAGLDLDAMVAAGPDSLKAHIAALSAKDGELASALAKVGELEAAATVTGTELTAAKGALASLTTTHATLCETVGFKADAKDADFSASFKAHVAKEAAVLLAKDGRPPVAHINPAATGGQQMARAAFDALPPRAQSDFCKAGGRIIDSISA